MPRSVHKCGHDCRRLSNVQSNRYLWSNKKDKTNSPLVKWQIKKDKMCKSLGFKILESFSRRLVDKAVWRMIASCNIRPLAKFDDSKVHVSSKPGRMDQNAKHKG